MAKETSSQLAERAINLRASQGNFERELEKKVKERADFNKDLISQLRGIEGGIVATPGMRADIAEQGAIRNPLLQEQVLARRRGSLGSQLGTISDILGERRGRQSDLVQAGLSDLMAEADRLTSLAQLRAQEEAASRARAAQRAQIAAMNRAMTPQATTPQYGASAVAIDPQEARLQQMMQEGMSRTEAEFALKNQSLDTGGFGDFMRRNLLDPISRAWGGGSRTARRDTATADAMTRGNLAAMPGATLTVGGKVWR